MKLQSNKWWAEVNKELDSEGQTKNRSQLKEAVQWYLNDETAVKKYFETWDGMVVRGNLYQRDIDLLFDSIWTEDPKVSAITQLRDPKFAKAAEAFEVMTKKAWDETEASDQALFTILEAMFSNVAFIKLEYDRFRQLPTVKWVEGSIAIDPKGAGDFKRASWVAEIVEMRVMDFLSDETFSEEKRKEVREQLDVDAAGKGEKFDFDRMLKLAYVWSKKGSNPWAKVTGRKLIVVTDVIETPVLEEEWPWPFLDHDAFPIYPLRINILPRNFFGISLWKKNQAVYQHYNWAASFMMEDARKAAQRKVLVNTNKVKDKEKLTSGKHMEIIECQGDPKEAIFLQDFGQGSAAVINTFELAKRIHDEQSGINEMARGESPGERVTAEEVRTRQNNSSSVFRGIARQVDKWLTTVMRDFTYAIIYYVPQWSRRVMPDGSVMEASYVPSQQIDPMGSPVYVWDYKPIAEEEAVGLPVSIGLDPGFVLRPGVDAWVGVNHALNWMSYDLEQLRRDFAFSIETGSTRTEHSINEQRTALTLMQSLLPIYQQYGCHEEVHALIQFYVNSFRVPNSGRFIPPQEKFLMGPMSYAPEPGQTPGKDKANPLQQPAAQGMGLGYGPEGLRGAGNPNAGQDPNRTLAGGNPDRRLPGAA